MDIPTTTKALYDKYVRVDGAAVTKYNGNTGRNDKIGWKTTNSGGTNQSASVTTVKSGTKTPGYYSIVKSGGILPCNAFTYSTTTIGYPYWEMNQQGYLNGNLWSTLSITGYYGGFPEVFIGSVIGPTAAQIASLDAEAVTKIRLALKDMKVNVALVIAERNKTAAMVAKAARTIAQMVLALKKGDLRGAAGAVGAHVGARKRNAYTRQHKVDPANAASNAWLELQYGWKPLLMDVRGAAEALAKQQYRPIRGKVNRTASMVVDKSTFFPGSGITDKNLGSVSVRYSVLYEVSSPSMPDFAGLGLLNPLELAWELVPFSFVLDWILPVGDWLSSLDATVGITFSDGSKSVKTNITRTRTSVQNTNVVSGSSVTNTRKKVTGSCVVDSVVRTKLFSFPAAQFPPFKDPTSISHMLTSIALLKKAFH